MYNCQTDHITTLLTAQIMKQRQNLQRQGLTVFKGPHGKSFSNNSVSQYASCDKQYKNMTGDVLCRSINQQTNLSQACLLTDAMLHLKILVCAQIGPFSYTPTLNNCLTLQLHTILHRNGCCNYPNT
jgi:hypothetical protein